MCAARISWTTEALEMLESLWRGGATAAVVAKSLEVKFGAPVARNAVIGKANRIGLSGTQKKPAPGKKRNRPSRAKAVVQDDEVVVERTTSPAPKEQWPTVSARATSDAAGGLVSLLDLQPNMCRFPIGDPRLSGFGFCGAHAQGESPYCPAHRAIAYVPKPEPVTKKNRTPDGMRRAQITAF